MDADLSIKLGSLAIGLIGLAITAWKFPYDLLRSRHGTYREQYRFAAEFLTVLSREPASLHPYAKQKGLQAIAGGSHLSTAEIEYLLSLQEPVQAMDDYVFSKKYLIHRPTAGETQIEFKKLYQAKWRRITLATVLLLLYFGTYCLAVAPLFLPGFKIITINQLLAMLPITLLVFLPMSYLALRGVNRIVRAQALVSRQLCDSGER